MTENELSKIVFDLGLKVHKALGPGLLESAYEKCLFYELKKNNIQVERQKIVPIYYDDIIIDAGYRIDLILENKLIIEIKVVNQINDLHLAQLLTYLKLSDCKLGLILNFNVVLFKTGVKRVINGDLRWDD